MTVKRKIQIYPVASKGAAGEKERHIEMKKILVFLLAAAMLLALTACAPKSENQGENVSPENTPAQTGEAVPPETSDPESAAPETQTPEKTVVRPELMIGSAEYIEYDDNGILSEVKWDEIILTEESARAFPALADILNAMNTEQEQYAAQQVKTLREDTEGMRQEGMTESYCSEEFSYYVCRSDKTVVSLLMEFASYYAGPHPNAMYDTINIDTANGEVITLSSVVTDVEQVKSIVAEKLGAKYAEGLYPEYEEWLLEYSEDAFNWTLDNRGITFYFSPYELAPYAAGMLSVTLWFDEYAGLINEKYTNDLQEDYAFELMPWTSYEIDIDPNDGKRDKLFVYTETLDEYGTKSVGIELNGSSLVGGIYCYECEFDLIKSGGRFFVYAESIYEGVQHTISVYELSGSEIDKVGELGAGSVGVYDGSAGAYGIRFTDVLSDPTDFELETWVTVILQDAVKRSYCVGADGMPTPKTEYYEYYEYAAEYVSLIPLTVEILPDGAKEELPAGTEFKPLRTNGVNYIDMLLTDGRRCRMEVDTDSWPNTIGGISVTECFGGLDPQW